MYWDKIWKNIELFEKLRQKETSVIYIKNLNFKIQI